MKYVTLSMWLKPSEDVQLCSVVPQLIMAERQWSDAFQHVLSTQKRKEEWKKKVCSLSDKVYKPKNVPRKVKNFVYNNIV